MDEGMTESQVDMQAARDEREAAATSLDAARVYAEAAQAYDRAAETFAAAVAELGRMETDGPAAQAADSTHATYAPSSETAVGDAASGGRYIMPLAISRHDKADYDRLYEAALEATKAVQWHSMIYRYVQAMATLQSYASNEDLAACEREAVEAISGGPEAVAGVDWADLEDRLNDAMGLD